jgi:hypothetical protein
LEIDLHGYSPDDLGCKYGLAHGALLSKIIQQAWEMGESVLMLIHGHGRNRGKSVGFVNTNTGFLGLCIRRALRQGGGLEQWIKHTTLDCSHQGRTAVKLKPNPSPSRARLDCLE